MEPVFGIIGCGGISRFHFDALANAGVRVAHVSDLQEETARPRVEQFGARYSADYRSLLADDDVTVVSVLTGGATHHRICIEALEAGKDVVCEKTMTNSSSEAREVVEAAGDSGRLFFTAYMKRFFPAVAKAQELLGRLGTLFSAHVRIYQAWGNYYDLDSIDERMEHVLNNYGGAVMKCAASHMIDMTLNLFGRPAGLYGYVDYVGSSRFDRRALGTLVYDSGFTVCLEAATHPLRKIGYERNSWDEGLEVRGTAGTLALSFVRWDAPLNNGVLLEHYDNESETLTEHRFDAVNPFDLEIAYFVECLRNRTQGHPDVMDGHDVDLVIETITTSHEKKAFVPLQWPSAPAVDCGRADSV